MHRIEPIYIHNIYILHNVPQCIIISNSSSVYYYGAIPILVLILMGPILTNYLKIYVRARCTWKIDYCSFKMFKLLLVFWCAFKSPTSVLNILLKIFRYYADIKLFPMNSLKLIWAHYIMHVSCCIRIVTQAVLKTSVIP